MAVELMMVSLPASDLRIELASARALVAGFPLWIAITVRNAARHLTETNLPPIPRLGSINVGITVRGTDFVVEVPSFDPSVRHGAPPGYALASGEARTFLVDLAETCPNLPAGEHGLEVVLPGERATGSLALRISPPTEDERDLAARVCGKDGWLHAMVFDLREPDIRWSTLSARTRAPLSMYALLRRATWAERLSDVPLAMLSGFTDLFEGEAAVLAYEIARAGKDPRAPALRRDAAARFPDLVWRLDETDHILGLLARLRELRELTWGSRSTMYGASRAS